MIGVLLLAAAGPVLDVSANLDIVSDYRFRGASLSAGRPAVQAGVSAAHRSGAFVEAWMSSLPRRSGSAEIDLGAGWTGQAGDTELVLGARAYLYPSLLNADYGELYGIATRSVGGVVVSVAAAYAPSLRNLARDDLHLSADASIPLRAETLSLVAHAGWERGSFNLTRTKWDWSAGFAYNRGPVTVTATNVDTDEPTGRDTDQLFAPTLLAGIPSASDPSTPLEVPTSARTSCTNNYNRPRPSQSAVDSHSRLPAATMRKVADP